MRASTLRLLLTLALVGCRSAGEVTQPEPGAGDDAAVRIPLTDMNSGDRYHGYEGNLYPGGSNLPPAAHREAGLARARAVQPLDAAGRPDPAGRIVLLSVGMSNTTQEFCSAQWRGPCESWSFVGQATGKGGLNPRLVLVNGANGGETTPKWASPNAPNYDRVRDQALRPLGLSEAQVQVVWLKVADARPTVSLPASNADAFQLLRSMGDVARALQVRYPNLRQVFLSSRDLRWVRNDGAEPRALRLRVGIRGQMADSGPDRADAPGNPGRQSRKSGVRSGAVARLGPVPVGQWGAAARGWAHLAAATNSRTTAPTHRNWARRRSASSCSSSSATHRSPSAGFDSPQPVPDVGSAPQ